MPTSWPSFHAAVDQMDLSNRRLIAAQAEFEAWACRTEERALAQAYQAADQRAKELLERTAVRIVVERPPRVTDRRLPPRFALTLGASRVDVYCVRDLGSAPSLHLGVQRAATSTRSPVFTTLPGVLLIRAPEDHFDALALPIPRDGRDPERTTLDGLVLRAFELLIATHRSTL